MLIIFMIGLIVTFLSCMVVLWLSNKLLLSIRRDNAKFEKEQINFNLRKENEE